MAIDYGERRLGIALTDPLKITAQPFATLDSQKHDFLPEILHLLQEKDVERLILGTPLGSDGGETEKSVAVHTFAEQLQAEISKQKMNVKIDFYNESYTTEKAKKALHQSGKKSKGHKDLLDRISAAIILQEYMRENC